MQKPITKKERRIRLINKVLRGTAPRLIDIVPTEKCHKCKSKCWYSDIEPLTWYCPICGNRIYFTYGVLRQQIDIITSSQRGRDYVQSERGAIIPITDGVIRTIRITAELEKLKAAKKCKRAKQRAQDQGTPTPATDPSSSE